MVASLVASLPVWARFDPLPVLLTDREREEEELAEREAEENMSEEEKAANRLLEGVKSAAGRAEATPA